MYRFVHTANVERAHKNGLKVIVWTINCHEEATVFMKKGVDGIASDKPDILKVVNVYPRDLRIFSISSVSILVSDLEESLECHLGS
jgi:hypothetical protein